MRSSSGCAAPTRCWCWTTASTSSTRRGPGRQAARRGAQLRILATSQLPLGLDGEQVVLAGAAERSPTRSRCSPRRADRAQRRLARTTPGHGSRLCRVARRPAAGDRARRGADQGAVRRGDRAPARRPVRAAAATRASRTPAAAPRAARRDRLELRPAVPRRPARPLGAVARSPAARRWPRSSGARPRSTCRPPRRSTSSAGWSTVRWLQSTSPPAARSATGCSTASARSPGPVGGGRRGTSRAPRTRRGSPRPPPRRAPALRGAGPAECLGSLAAERAEHRRRAGLGAGARPAAGRCASRTASAGPGWSRRRQRRGTAVPARAGRRPDAAAAGAGDALLLAAWIEASGGDLDRAVGEVARR